MVMKRQYSIVIVAMFVIFCGSVSLVCGAETQDTQRSRFHERLRILKEKDPEAFQRVVKKHKDVLSNKLAELKEQDPARYSAIQESIRQRRVNNAYALKDKNPEQ